MLQLDYRVNYGLSAEDAEKLRMVNCYPHLEELALVIIDQSSIEVSLILVVFKGDIDFGSNFLVFQIG